MSSQKESVCNTILFVLSEKGVNYQMGGEVRVKDVLDKQDIETVRSIVTEGFKSGEISMTETAKNKYDTDAKLNKYVSGLVTNWINRSPEFNCGEKYKPANPGSRRGQSDDTIKALRQLLKTEGLSESDEAQINVAIQERLAEIAPKVEIKVNTEALPDHLKHLA